MTSRLPGILDHLVLLLEGRISGLDRAIPAKTFRHSKVAIEHDLARASDKPRPFDLARPRHFRPFLDESNVAGDEVYRGFAFDLRVGYAVRPHSRLEQQQQVARDTHEIHRCLSDPDSWLAATGWSRMTLSESSSEERGVPGANFEEQELLLILTIPCEITYREDYS